MAQPTIRTIGIIRQPHGPRTYEATLPNGKVVVAHVPAKRQAELGGLNCGTRVTLELTTYDFSMARIASTISE